MPLIIKGRVIGTEHPAVCVPVMKETDLEIFTEAERLVRDGVPMLEWRIDAYEGWRDAKAVREILTQLRDITKQTVLIATLRSRAEGGEAGIAPYEKALLYDEIAQAHCADLIDVEYASYPDAEGLIKSLQQRGALVLVSHHNFARTPSAEEITAVLEEMEALDADMIKLAVMPKNEADVDTLMRAASGFSMLHPLTPMIAISMSALGSRSRRMARQIGSCVTFAAGADASAPGQIPYRELL